MLFFFFFFFFFNDTATTEIYTLSLHDALPIRHGCRSLTQLEILPKPPLVRAADNPWPQWPKVYKLDYGQEEAAARFGADPRDYCVTTRRFLGDAEGRVSAIETVRIEWVRDNGRFAMKEVPGSERTWPATLV